MINLSPRDYQKSIFETAKENNTLVVLPTGIGKTLIALMLAVHRLQQFPGKKILMLAPTKPLVEQHLQSFKKNLPELFADLQLFTGAVSAQKRRKIWQTADVIFATPQTIANDLKSNLYNLSNVSLLVIDEAHRCLKNYDYTYIANQYKEQAEDQRILGLTASPGSEKEKVEQICKHLAVEEVEIRSRDSPDVKPYLKEREFQKIEVPFPQEFIEIKVLLKKLYDEKIEKLKSKNLLFGPVNKITLLALQKKLAAQLSSKNFIAMQGISLCAQAIKISHAIELLETQTLSGLNEYLSKLKKEAEEKKSKGVQTLVNSGEFRAAFLSLTQLIEQKIEHPKIEELKVLIESEFNENKNAKIIIFSQFRETALTISKKLNQLKGIKAKLFVGQLKKGETGLSQKEQKAVIEQFKSGEINVLVSTSVGEEGIDVPEVSAVVFYETLPSAIRAIQRSGRTARLSPGKIMLLMTKDTRDITYHYVSRAREKKMQKTIGQVKDNLKNNNENNNNNKDNKDNSNNKNKIFDYFK